MKTFIALIAFGMLFATMNTVANTFASRKLALTLEGDVIGEAYNSDDKQDVVAITYAIASDGGHNMADLSVEFINQHYRAPTVVEKLPDVIAPPAQGPLESIEEVPSVTTYYDGSLSLNVARVDCHVLQSQNSCVKQTSCGTFYNFPLFLTFRMVRIKQQLR